MALYIFVGKLYHYMYPLLLLYIYYTNYLACSLSIPLHLSLFVLNLRNYSSFFFDMHLYLLHSNCYLHFLLIYIHLYIHYRFHLICNNPPDIQLILMLHYLLLYQILSTLLLQFPFHLLYNQSSYQIYLYMVSHFHFYSLQL